MSSSSSSSSSPRLSSSRRRPSLPHINSDDGLESYVIVPVTPRTNRSPLSEHELRTVDRYAAEGDDTTRPLLLTYDEPFDTPTFTPRPTPTRKSSINEPKPTSNLYDRSSTAGKRCWGWPLSIALAVGLGCVIVRSTRPLIVTNKNEKKPAVLVYNQWGTSTKGTTESSASKPARPRKSHEWWKPEVVLNDEGKRWPQQGGNGSLIKTENGKVFVYQNDFGGTWDARKESLDARCQADTPTLAEYWDYEKRTISGVNLGGWLALEPFITPHLFEPYLKSEQEVIDEYTLSVQLGDRLESVLTHHYETFMTERDFAEIAGAGLTWIRLPLPYWAIETIDGEPFLSLVAWKYFLKAIEWARKYGLRINLDLHAVPGSANGWNHSGKSGTVGLLNGVMGIANAERTLNIVRALAKFISLPINRNVIGMFSVINEPALDVIGTDALRAYYLKLYDTVREESGFGEGNGPVIVIHDGFVGPAKWTDFMEGADRVAMDSHRYIAFRPANPEPLQEQALKPCELWMRHFNRTMRMSGVAMVAEWSIATNDCGRFLNGVHAGTRFEGTYVDPESSPAGEPGTCEFWENAALWDDVMKRDLQDVAYGHMDAFQNWFYWTWKTGPSVLHPSRPANPLWSYRHGLREGCIPRDPRRSRGFCVAQHDRFQRPLGKMTPYSGRLKDWMVGRGNDPGSQLKRGQYVWPPEKIGMGGEAGKELETKDLPRWVETASEGPLKIPSRMAGEQGEEKENSLWYEPIEGCEYLDPWEGVGPDVPIPGGCQSLRS